MTNKTSMDCSTAATEQEARTMGYNKLTYEYQPDIPEEKRWMDECIALQREAGRAVLLVPHRTRGGQAVWVNSRLK